MEIDKAASFVWDPQETTTIIPLGEHFTTKKKKGGEKNRWKPVISPLKEDAMRFLTAQQMWLIFFLGSTSPINIFSFLSRAEWLKEWFQSSPSCVCPRGGCSWGCTCTGHLSHSSHENPSVPRSGRWRSSSAFPVHSLELPFLIQLDTFHPIVRDLWIQPAPGSGKRWESPSGGVVGDAAAPSPKGLRIPLELPSNYPLFPREGGGKSLYFYENS